MTASTSTSIATGTAPFYELQNVHSTSSDDAKKPADLDTTDTTEALTSSDEASTATEEPAKKEEVATVIEEVVEKEEIPAKKEATTTTNDNDSDSDSDSPLPQMPRIRSSIKLKSLVEDIPVKLKRGSFRTLPPPDMDKIKRAATLPAYMNPEDVFRIMSGTNNEDDRGDLSVRFDQVKIRAYDQTLGDNPSVSYGPPIALDWKYEEKASVAVEDYEKERKGSRRAFKKLGLNYYQRKALLSGEGGYGHSEDDLKNAKKQANKDKFKRAVTKYFLPLQKVEDVAESAGRKFKRTVLRRQKST